MYLTINPEAKAMLETGNFSDILSVKDVQTILGICRISVYRQIEEGHLDAFTIGKTYMIPKESVCRFLKNREGGDRT